MATPNHIDSSATGLRIAEEGGSSIGTLSGSEIWYPHHVTSYGDFGGTNDRTEDEPITEHGMKEKGNVTSREVAANFTESFRYHSFQKVLQGLLYSDLNTNVELDVADVDGTGNDFEPASGGDGFAEGDLLLAKDFDDSENNGLFVVDTGPAATSVPVTGTLTTAATQSGVISKVGVELSSGDCSVDVTGTWPKLVVSTYDWTDLGVEAGDIIFVGGDDAAEQFANSENNGFLRVRSVSATELEVDKSSSAMTTDTGSGKTIRVFTARYLKNQAQSTNQTRRTYQLERSLGAPDDASPSQIQYEYIIGGLLNQMVFNMDTQDRISVDLSFLATGHEFVDGPTSEKAGTRPDLSSEGIWDTSNHVVLNQLSEYTEGSEAPTALFSFLTNFQLTLGFQNTGLTAFGQASFFDFAKGMLMASMSATAYFQTVDSTESIQDNDDFQWWIAMFHSGENKGVVLDVPLVAVGDGKNNVAINEAVTVPVTMEGFRGTKISDSYDHAVHFSFFDYLPALAETNP